MSCLGAAIPLFWLDLNGRPNKTYAKASRSLLTAKRRSVGSKGHRTVSQSSQRLQKTTRARTCIRLSRQPQFSAARDGGTVLIKCPSQTRLFHRITARSHVTAPEAARPSAASTAPPHSTVPQISRSIAARSRAHVASARSLFLPTAMTHILEAAHVASARPQPSAPTSFCCLCFLRPISA